jgi:hypothetical protein
MALATTQAVWRSGGGDQTRTAYCGSMVMAAQFYIPAAGTAGNVQVSSTNTAAVVLPAGAIVSGVTINNVSSAGAIDLGYTLNTTGTAVADGLLNNATATSIVNIQAGGTGAGTALGTLISSTELITITNADGGSGAGDVGGYITYFIYDNGQQNV